MQEPLQAFRDITIPLDLGDDLAHPVVIPFDIELLERFETCLQKCEDVRWTWLRRKKSDKTIIDACVEFCRPYLPEEFEARRMQPSFFLLFFSRVREELRASMPLSDDSTSSTAA